MKVIFNRELIIKGVIKMTILVVGGNERMKRDYINIGREKGYKTKVILNMSSKALKDFGSPDAVVMFTSTISHKLKAVVETQVKKKNIPIIRHYNNSKVSFMECLEKVRECNGDCDSCIYNFKKSKNFA